MESLRAQTHEDIEHIVIDGGSTDGTQKIVEEFSTHISFFVSEPDNGIYDAMNKGLAHATGEIVSVLNADDELAGPGVLTNIVRVFADNPKIDCLYSDLVYVSREHPAKILRYWVSGEYSHQAFERGWHPPHPTFFVRRHFYQQLGPFDLQFPIAADYELMLRFLYKDRLRPFYLKEVTYRMKTGGTSNRSLGNIYRSNLQCWQAWRKNGLTPPWSLIFRKLLFKIGQITVKTVNG